MDLIKSIKNSAGEKIMKIKQILCLLFIATALFTTCSNSSSSSSSDDSVSQETPPQVFGCSSNADCPEGTTCTANSICEQTPNTPACEDGEVMCVDNGNEAWQCINGEWNITECAYGCVIHSNGNVACADSL